jgi:lysostaphin
MYYSGGEIEVDRGGLVQSEPSTTYESGLPVHYAYIEESREVLMEREGVSAIASSNPLTNLVATRDGLKRYVVRKGDTITGIAASFGISKETVQSANGGIRSVQVGQSLIILPITGVLYDVKTGDTLDSISVAHQISPETIKQYNADYQKIFSAGKGTLILAGAKPVIKNAYVQTSAKLISLSKGFLTIPVAGNNLAELHAQNAVDIINKCGTPVKAAADGTVIIDDELNSDGASGWNNGYGVFVLIQHDNGVKTRYAHLEKSNVKTGEDVAQGAVIGYVGNSGNTEGPSGCHLHFEVLNAKNPFATR